jgi:hypothetical protein
VARRNAKNKRKTLIEDDDEDEYVPQAPAAIARSEMTSTTHRETTTGNQGHHDVDLESLKSIGNVQ